MFPCFPDSNFSVYDSLNFFIPCGSLRPSKQSRCVRPSGHLETAFSEGKANFAGLYSWLLLAQPSRLFALLRHGNWRGRVPQPVDHELTCLRGRGFCASHGYRRGVRRVYECLGLRSRTRPEFEDLVKPVSFSADVLTGLCARHTLRTNPTISSKW
jgi:hypothetical protein